MTAGQLGTVHPAVRLTGPGARALYPPRRGFPTCRRSRRQRRISPEADGGAPKARAARLQALQLIPAGLCCLDAVFCKGSNNSQRTNGDRPYGGPCFQLCCARLSITRLSTIRPKLSKNLAPAARPSHRHRGLLFARRQAVRSKRTSPAQRATRRVRSRLSLSAQIPAQLP